MSRNGSRTPENCVANMAEARIPFDHGETEPEKVCEGKRTLQYIQTRCKLICQAY